MSKKEQDDVTLDVTNDEETSAENSNEEITETDTEETEDNELVEDSSDDNDSESETKSNNDESEEPAQSNNVLLIVEIIAVLAIIGFIIYTVVMKNDNSVSGNNVSTNTVSGQTVSGATIDNSILFESTPAIPDVSTVNTMTLEECEARVADGTMIKLATADGIDVYVNNYTDSEYFNAEATYSDEDIDSAIQNDILEPLATTVSTNRTVAQENDVVDIDFVGVKDGEAFEGGTAQGQQLLLGSNSYIPGFEDGIIGMEVGETKDVTVTFPEDYGNESELAGQEVVFTISLNSIVGETTYPELTDDLVSANYPDFTSVEDLRTQYSEAMLKDSIWKFLTTEFYVASVSNDTVMNYYDSSINYYDTMSQSYGISISDLLAQYGSSVDELRDGTMSTSLESAMYSALYHSIADNNNLTVTDEDIATLAADYDYTDTTAFLADYGEAAIRDYILQDKIMDYLITLHE